MNIKVRLHAMLREIAGTDVIEIPLDPDRATTAAIFESLVDRHPELGPWSGVVAFAIDQKVVGPGAEIPAETSILDVLPPVSGG